MRPQPPTFCGSLTWPLVVAVGIGLILLAQHLVLRGLSEHFYYESSLAHSPIPWLVAIQVSAGLIFLGLIWVIPKLRTTHVTVAAMLMVGLLLRLSLLGSTPILEDDFYRYLWDGALLSHQQDPYSFAPAEATQANVASVTRLADEAGPIFERINYPELRTVYPPVVQGAFALAHWLKPWSLAAWRSVLLGFDILTVTLILVLLRSLKRSPLWAALYWWNPLVTKELFNSAHMDVLLLPFLLGFVLFIIHRRSMHAAGSLAVATGIKLWPVLLLPFVLRPLVGNTRKLVGVGLLFTILALVLLSPLCLTGLDKASGFVAYTRLWEMNDALFQLVAYSATAVVSVFGVDTLDAGVAARGIVACVLIGLALWLNRTGAHDPQELCRKIVLIIAALFLLSPAQFPWYYVWLVPFLTVCPVYGLLALTAVLPLYYLRFYFDARDQSELFDYGIVWLEYLPVWILLIGEWIVARRNMPQTLRTSCTASADADINVSIERT